MTERQAEKARSCPTCTGPTRETVDMVCQTCGTDYANPVHCSSCAKSATVCGRASTYCCADCSESRFGTHYRHASPEPDAYLDADGLTWINLRKWPNGWPGAYEFTPDCTPLHLNTLPGQDGAE